MSYREGEKPGAREAIDKMTGHLIREGHSPDKAAEVARRAALNHHHNEGRRDPNRRHRK